MQKVNSLKTRFSLLFFFSLFFTQPCWACFPGYEPSHFVVGAVTGPISSLEKHQGLSFNELFSKYTPYYLFQTKNLSDSNWSLIFMGLEPTFSEYKLAIYPTINDQISGFVLLEQIQNNNPCTNDEQIRKGIQGKTILKDYIAVEMPAEYKLEIYEKRNAEHIQQFAILTTPGDSFEVPPHRIRRNIIMRAKYPKILESIIKPEIQKYFQTNVSEWVDNAILLEEAYQSETNP